ncbi:hypothetical protein Q4Q39_03780 [Flavivirga amylovorans]|uniref:Lipoprotein n=1 Tax=Flavivirga amylovorans TaxID=870486 RepID=A0ABT8WXW4_9FLAO|nr:hypothetical protein [Flavivirga amylovorans]MDO5986519.1 hypothetical protein [Flavivirga amylovorans]
MKQILLRTTLLFFITIFFTNCNKENIGDVPVNNIQKIKRQFSLENFNDNTIKDNLHINWEDYIKTESTNKESIIYEFNSINTGNNLFENGNQKLYYKYKVLATKKNLDIWDIQLIKFLTIDNEILDIVSYLSPNGFSGTLYHYDLMGKTIKIKGYENGVKISELTDLDLLSKKPEKQEPIDHEEGGGSYQLVTITHYTDWYANIHGGTTLYYTHSVYSHTTYEYVYVSSNSSSGTTYHNHTSQNHGGTANNNHNNESILDEDIIVIEGPDKSITNLADYLKCLDSSQPAVFTIYVDQPTPNKREALNNALDVGHTFISIQQDNNVASFGFYPAEGVGYRESVNGIMGDNSNYSFDVSISIPVDASKLNSIINYSVNFSQNVTYNLQTNNCSNFGIYTANLAGLPISVSEATGNWILGNGANPGALGQQIRNMNLPQGANLNTNGGSSPNNNCN